MSSPMARALAFIEAMVLLLVAAAVAGPARLPECLVTALAGLVAFYYADLYDLRTVRSLGPFLRRLPVALGLGLLLLTGIQALAPALGLGVQPVGACGLLALVAILPLRAACYTILGGHPFVERVLIVGSGPLARRIADELGASPRFGEVLIGVAEDAPASLPKRCLRLGPLERLDGILEEFCPERVIVALDERRGRMHMEQLLEPRMRGMLVEDGADVYERLTGKLAIEALSPSSILFSRAFRKPALQHAFGRAVSLAAAAAALLFLLPLLLLLALVIRLESPGPLFFIQERVGLWGRAFRLIKFRTMLESGDRKSEWVKDNDDRITRVGRWLRRFRLDELPQFINVVRGDMNLIGPRPHPVSNQLLFLEQIPYYQLRAVVRPGLTGWAQVRYGYANSLAEETEKMRYDLYYIKHMSVRLDLRILFETVKMVLFGRGATGVASQAAELAKAAELALAMAASGRWGRRVQGERPAEAKASLRSADVAVEPRAVSA